MRQRRGHLEGFTHIRICVDRTGDVSHPRAHPDCPREARCEFRDSRTDCLCADDDMIVRVRNDPNETVLVRPA